MTVRLRVKGQRSVVVTPVFVCSRYLRQQPEIVADGPEDVSDLPF